MTERDLRSSHQFAAYATVPAAAVWCALTGPATTSYLHGLSLRTSWVVGDLITFSAAPGPASTLHGVVLYVDEPARLTYSMQSGPDDPLVFVTWRLRECSGGCAITLVVDDLDCPADSDEAEAVWLPVLANLQRHLMTRPR